MAIIGWALHFSGYTAEGGGHSSALLWTMTLPTIAGALACAALLSKLSMSHAEVERWQEETPSHVARDG